MPQASTTPTENKAVTGETISHYKILEELGRGGMGEVYLAQDTELDRKAALKFLPPQYTTDTQIRIKFKHAAIGR